MSPGDAHAPNVPFNAPFVARNSVAQEENPYIPLDADSEEDFNQSDYDACGCAGYSLKNW